MLSFQKGLPRPGLVLLMILLAATEVIGTETTFVRSGKPHVDFLEPTNHTDLLGNKVDGASSIDFFHSKARDNYKAGEDEDPVSIVMASWFYDISATLATSAMSGSFPFELLVAFRDGQLEDVDLKKTIADHAGYLTAVIVGLLFLVVLPIASVCFCCCRGCGRCGGRRALDDTTYIGDNKNRCGRIQAVICFTVPLFCALVGICMMFLANHSISVEMHHLQDGGLDKIDDVTTYIDNTKEQGDVAIQGKCNFTLEVLERDLTNIGFLVGQPTRSSVIQSIGLEEVFDQIFELEDDAKSVLALLEETESLKDSYDENSKDIADEFAASVFHTKLEKARKQQLSNFQGGIAYLNKMNAAHNTRLKSVARTISNLKVFLDDGLRTKIEQARKDLNEVPQKIETETETKREEILNEFSDYILNMQKRILMDLEKLRNNILGGTNLSNLKDSGEDGLETVLEYDNYRWYVGLALGGLALLVVLLLLLSLILGIFGGRARVEPAGSRLLSKRGGSLLLAGTVLAFIASWILMLLTTPVFMVGAPAETVACGPMRDLSILDKMIDNYDLLQADQDGSGTWLSDIFPGMGEDVNLGQLMSACTSGETLYEAFKLGNTDLFDLEQLAEVNETLDIDAALKNLTVDFTGTKVDYDELINFLNLMSSIKTKIIDDVLDEAIANSAPVLLEDFQEHLSQRIKTSASLSNDEQKYFKDLQSEAGHFEFRAVDMIREVTVLKSIRGQLKRITDPSADLSLTERANKLKGLFQSADLDWSNVAEAAYKKALSKFSGRVKSIFSQAAEGLQKTIKSELGVCTPLFNVYNDLLVKGLCDQTVGSLNAWACAMGMTSVFLALTTCTTCHLSKHLYGRRINGDEDSRDGDGVETTTTDRAAPSAPPIYELAVQNDQTKPGLRNGVSDADTSFTSDNGPGNMYPSINHRVSGGFYY